MLLRSTDPFRDFDRLASQLLGTGGTTNRPAVMPMDAWREGDRFVIEFDLPGVSKDSIDIDVERNVLTVRAERVAGNGDWQRLASERDGVPGVRIGGPDRGDLNGEHERAHLRCDLEPVRVRVEDRQHLGQQLPEVDGDARRHVDSTVF